MTKMKQVKQAKGAKQAKQAKQNNGYEQNKMKQVKPLNLQKKTIEMK